MNKLERSSIEESLRLIEDARIKFNAGERKSDVATALRVNVLTLAAWKKRGIPKKKFDDLRKRVDDPLVQYSSPCVIYSRCVIYSLDPERDERTLQEVALSRLSYENIVLSRALLYPGKQTNRDLRSLLYRMAVLAELAFPGKPEGTVILKHVEAVVREELGFCRLCDKRGTDGYCDEHKSIGVLAVGF